VPTTEALAARLAELMPADERRLRRRLDGARRIRDPRRREAVTAEIVTGVEKAERRLARRRAAVPELKYPDELPISQRRDEIAEAIRDHQVVIVAGETGSGKTTQLPKICLELGRGVRGMIGHTQPRRLAARTVADRIAEETGTTLGEQVGYQVRFTATVGDDTLVKLMTDGILLAELAADRLLERYDTLIIDEAHERSLNIDFILGYLKQLLPRRPDLKVIITSATIDPERFSRHFGDAPVIEVSGRTYPVEMRYRPLVAEDPDRDQVQAISDAVDELSAEGRGDILVFLSGEREIRDTADFLRRRKLVGVEILPLYARLTAAEQHRVFAPHGGRRIVLATNVAETSLTVPGIRYVVDPGFARISRYSHRLKVQRLPIEPVSQASARQRAGRCGRVAAGICVRLYSEEDFEARPEFTEPEIQRTNLASVILQMTALGLGDLERFPFVDPPDRRSLTDGVRLLHELGAIDPQAADPRQRLTPLGRRLAALPLDPRLGRMVLAAERDGCAREVLVIATALSIQDPRERPVEHRAAADAQHARFAEPDSDFMAFVNLWRYVKEKQKELSGNQFRRMCATEYLHYLRIREWQDLYSQVKQVMRDLEITLNSEPAPAQRVHTALMTGLLSHIGLRDPENNEYLGARGAKFVIWPGSGLAKKPPQYVMAAELVETSRLFARVVAKIDPAWVEPLAEHLVKRTYSEPRWSAKRGAVLATERVTLYGVPIVVGRSVQYGRIDPVLSRELFIRHALVEGDWRTHHRFFHENRSLLEEVEELEHRARRRDILVDDHTLFDFYDRRLPDEVVSAAHFDSWWKKARRDTPDLLSFEKSMLVNAEAGGVAAGDYPDTWPVGDLTLRLTYQFEPGSAADGVTAHIPLDVLNQVEDTRLDWQVPGLREDLVIALLRGLPKQIRKSLVPVPDTARELLARTGPADGPLLDTLAGQLRALGGIHVPRDAWEPAKVPEHLRVTYRVSDGNGAVLGEGKDLAALRRALLPQATEAVAVVAEELERHGLTDWTIGELPRVVERERAGRTVKAYPALVDERDAVGVKVFGTEGQAAGSMWQGTRRLVLLAEPGAARYALSHLDNPAKLALARNPHGAVPALLEDCVTCAVDKLIHEAGGPPRDAAGWGKLRELARGSLGPSTLEVVRTVRQVLVAAAEVDKRLSRTNLSLMAAMTDIRAQLGGLVYPGFVTATGWWRLPDLPRYLEGIAYRLDRLPTNRDRDLVATREVQEVQEEYAALKAEGVSRAGLHEVRWMIEELRVSLFAQPLGAAPGTSEKRILDAIAALSRTR
jgi:ATP-dependent helicase HrpA